MDSQRTGGEFPEPVPPNRCGKDDSLRRGPERIRDEPRGEVFGVCVRVGGGRGETPEGPRDFLPIAEKPIHQPPDIFNRKRAKHFSCKFATDVKMIYALFLLFREGKHLRKFLLETGSIRRDNCSIIKFCTFGAVFNLSLLSLQIFLQIFPNSFKSPDPMPSGYF